jgi:hypothetical protein
MESGFEYYAFISYKREDEKWAKWLQKKLEGYRLPAIIRKEIPRLPKRIRPIFRDKTDLGAGMLTENLRKELEKSQYLIVICSPLSAQSEWVGNEITAFTEMGRAKRIIPFIVDGKPNSNDERECFHPVIKEKIPDALGININEIGKQQAYVKVAAKLLDLRFDTLWNRFLREQRKQRVIAAVAGLLFLVGSVVVWDYNRTKVEYYADYVDKWGKPEGIIQLSESDVEKRERHYRFESSQKRLRRVVFANSAGTPVNHSHTEHTDRPAIQVLHYEDEDIYPSKTEMKNAQGKTIAVYSWGGENQDTINIQDMARNPIALTSFFTSLQNLFDTSILNILPTSSYYFLDKKESIKVNIKYLELKRDDGYITHKLFKKNSEDPACDASGIWGFEYNLDDSGRVKELYYLGKNENPLPNKTGVMWRKYEYDNKSGNISKIEYFDKDNKHINNEQGWAICEDVSNKNGNIEKSLYIKDNGDIWDEVTWEYDDKNGNRIKEAGLSGGWTAIYNKRGLMKEQTHFGDNRVPNWKIGDVVRATWQYDKSGNVTDEAYFNYEGKPCRNYMNGAVKWTALYDKSGMREQAYFDFDGKRCNGNYGFAIVKCEYYKSGEIKNQTYYDENGNPCYIGAGFAKVEYKYIRGNRTEWAYFGTDGKNLSLLKHGYAKVKVDYDDFGNVKTVAFFDDNNKPILLEDGFAKVVYKYDNKGDMIEEVAFFDIIDDKISLYKGEKGEYAKMIQEYDGRGNLRKQAFFGVNNERVLLEDGFAEVVWVYDDEQGHLKEKAFFGINEGERVKCKKGPYKKGGYWKMTLQYDLQGNILEQAYLGVDGKPILLDEGFAKVIYKYNKGLLIEESFFGVIDGERSMYNDKYAKMTYNYDEEGNEIGQAYFWLDDNSILLEDVEHKRNYQEYVWLNDYSGDAEISVFSWNPWQPYYSYALRD